MKAVLISDLHLRTKEPLDSAHREWRLQEKLRVLKQAVQVTIDEGAEFLGILGDVFDTKEPPEWLKKAFWECLLPLLLDEEGPQVYIILGNHDSNLQNHAFESIGLLSSRLSNQLRIFEEPQTLIIGDVAFLFAPYCKQEDLQEVLEAYDYSSSELRHIFLGHHELDGAEMGPHQIQIKARVKPQDLDHFDAVIMGHIHKAQFGDLVKGKWWYIGSPVYQDFGEANDPAKGFILLNLEPHKTKVDWVPTNPVPMATLEIGPDDNDTLLDEYLDQIPECVVRIQFRGPETWLKGTDVTQWRELFQESERKGRFVKVVFDSFCTDRELEEEEVGATIEEEMERYCQDRDPSMLPIGMEMLEEARNAD